MAIGADTAGTQGLPSTKDAALESPYIKLSTYNIQSGRSGRLEIVLREMELMNIDVSVFTKD